ncbi:MAG TPA: excinuclease ABC subunit UvrC [Anaerohalosphaeraceae bacterium]|nr:excinuclease ABC subunit UvrC [Anaerohalosphaeraceae bacterium]HOL32417.1 excinuclease ABC subunit UvrC [Anaerohalosphaeraceae bacterium]HOM75974.1 excinuclease ABC subunit UvrC [Anaerohalosphaeraceae bacterium]HPC62984.1 excinuclease ABC subunit UvrC [Anaerohalosphaeraceae bacterium]HPO70931.1 excinuclease ABC subunit UvrC [Anaerohalosphaeraceae bacterium]
MAKKASKAAIEQIRAAIRSFPTGPGLYFMKDAQEKVLYIGKARNLRSRVASYFQPSANLAENRSPWIAEMISRTAAVDYLQTESEVDAVLQEARLIKDIHPPYNTDLKDAKTFPYLEITTRQEYPAVYITRNPQDQRSLLMGPFTSAGDLRAVIGVLQRIYRFRTCTLDIRSSDDKRRFFRPCILYNIRQCTAPCGDRVSKEAYRAQIRDLIRFLCSKRSRTLADLKRRMTDAAAALDFETAAMYRDRIRLIEALDKRGSLDRNVQPEVFAGDPSEALVKLQTLLESSQPVRIIEGFDIAHLAGSAMVGAMVQFIDGRPFKDGYRRYKIRSVKGIDDYACLQEIVSRRYKQAMAGQELWPDLVLIDGGIGQLHAVEEVFSRMHAPLPKLASLAKKQEIVYLHGRTEPLRLPAHSPVRKLLQYVRDEAHRFAQHYHHLLRSRRLTEDETQKD